MDFIEKRQGGLVYLTAPNIAAPHAFTTRLGGVSRGIYESLNFRTNCGDSLENVRENYRRLGAALGMDPERLVFTRQVHGSVVRVVTEEDIHTLGTLVPYEADGIVTNRPGLGLICFTADCIPVLLCDGENGVIAAVHCGWRPSVADILGNAVSQMRALGAKPESISAAIGPGIDSCCFQVGREVVDAAAHWLGEGAEDLWSEDENEYGKYFLDLKSANARRLEQLGLRPENIAVSGDCTMCLHDKYWSHRYTGGRRGVQASVIWLEEKNR